jgi:hypothetical protein
MEILMKRPVDSLIVTVRGRKVLLDTDLAAIYRVTTKALNQAVTAGEWAKLKSAIAASRGQGIADERLAVNWSQSVTSSRKH